MFLTVSGDGIPAAVLGFEEFPPSTISDPEYVKVSNYIPVEGNLTTFSPEPTIYF